MSEWKEIRLGKAINLKRGYDLPKSKRQIGKYPIISSSGTTDFHNEYKKLPPGVITGRYGTIGKVFYTKKEYWPLNTTLYVEDFKGNNPKFIYFFLQSFNFEKFNDKSTVPGINRNHLHIESVNIPPLPEQKAIAEVLSSLDDKIDLLHRQNETLEQMAETLFRQWFVEEADEEWEEGVISDIATHSRESIKPQSNPDTLYKHYSIPAFDNDKNPVSELGIEIKSNKYGIPENSILFSKLNPHKDKRIWLMQDNIEKNSICSTEFQIVKPIEKDFLYFIYGWLTLNINFRKIASGVGGTSGSHQRISPLVIFDFPCPIIPVQVVKEYNKTILPIFQKMVYNRTQIKILESIRDTLLPKMMNGEVRIKEDRI